MVRAGRIPLTLTILPTYQCTAACNNCCFGSNPWLKGRIPQERILRYIDDAVALGMKQVVFSGGEPFLLHDDLRDAIAHATRLGLLTRIVTNGYWAVNEQAALRRLKPLREAGLTELNLSTGDYHQQFVPPARIVNAAVVSVSLEMMALVMVEARDGRRFTAENLLEDPRLSSIRSDPAKTHLFVIVESPWMPIEAGAVIHQDKCAYLTRENLHTRVGCNSVLGTVVVTPDERLGACCGLTREQIPELNLGSLREQSMEELTQAALGDFLKIWIHVEGPEHIVAWAAEKDPLIQWEGRFAHTCDVCRFLYHDPRVRAIIKKYYREKVPDVLLRFSTLNYFPVAETQAGVRGPAAGEEVGQQYPSVK
jgi:Radical SAM superfamily